MSGSWMLEGVERDGAALGAVALPDPGPETVVRGQASDLLLALWHRRCLLGQNVSGDRSVLERRPRS